jgi:hypothetical protein
MAAKKILMIVGGYAKDYEVSPSVSQAPKIFSSFEDVVKHYNERKIKCKGWKTSESNK